MIKPIRKLQLSVFFGWGVILIATIFIIFQGGGQGLFSGIFLGLIILGIRYSLVKPVHILGGAIASWGYISFWSYISGLRANGSDGYRSFMTIWLSFVLVLVFSLVKGALVAAYLLYKETNQLIMFYRDKERIVKEEPHLAQ